MGAAGRAWEGLALLHSCTLKWGPRLALPVLPTAASILLLAPSARGLANHLALPRRAVPSRLDAAFNLPVSQLGLVTHDVETVPGSTPTLAGGNKWGSSSLLGSQREAI